MRQPCGCEHSLVPPISTCFLCDPTGEKFAEMSGLREKNVVVRVRTPKDGQKVYYQAMVREVVETDYDSYADIMRQNEIDRPRYSFGSLT